MVELTAQEKMVWDVRKDFLVYAPACLHILTKRGDLVPFEVNDAQKLIHEKIEEQEA